MDAKEFLQQVRVKYAALVRLENKLTRLQNSVTSIDLVDLSEERVQGGNIAHDKIGDKIAAIDECRTELHRKRAECEAFRNDVRLQIASLSNARYSEILDKRYLQFKRWDEIADEMNFEYVYMRGMLHSKALQAFEQEIIKNS